MTAGTRRSVRWTVQGQGQYIFYIVRSKSLAKQGAERKLRQGCRLCRPRRSRVSPSYALFMFAQSMSVSEERSSWNRRCILGFWRLNLFRLRWQFYSTFSTLVGNCPENGLNACLFFYWVLTRMTRSWFLIFTVCFGSCAHNIYGSELCECSCIGAVSRFAEQSPLYIYCCCFYFDT